MALGFFGAFIIIYNELKNDFNGRLKLNFGGIDCEFRDSARLLPLLLKSITTFLITWSSWIDVFFFTSATQCRKM